MSNIKDLITDSDKLIVLNFKAGWCGPCKMLSPIIDEIKIDFNDKAIVEKVDIETSPELATDYNIRSVPTLVFIKKGEVVEKRTGILPKTEISEMIENHL